MAPILLGVQAVDLQSMSAEHVSVLLSELGNTGLLYRARGALSDAGVSLWRIAEENGEKVDDFGVMLSTVARHRPAVLSDPDVLALAAWLKFRAAYVRDVEDSEEIKAAYLALVELARTRGLDQLGEVDPVVREHYRTCYQ